MLKFFFVETLNRRRCTTMGFLRDIGKSQALFDFSLTEILSNYCRPCATKETAPSVDTRQPYVSPGHRAVQLGIRIEDVTRNIRRTCSIRLIKEHCATMTPFAQVWMPPCCVRGVSNPCARDLLKVSRPLWHHSFLPFAPFCSNSFRIFRDFEFS